MMPQLERPDQVRYERRAGILVEHGAATHLFLLDAFPGIPPPGLTGGGRDHRDHGAADDFMDGAGTLNALVTTCYRAASTRCVEFRILGPLEALDHGRRVPLAGGRQLPS
jgi:hypothetical protein